MGSGPESRSRLRRHVRAAREWLGRAEDSLERAEDVRGDLELMLARAELARARETERPRLPVLWARRLAPLCVAALLAGGGLSIWHAMTPQASLPALGRRAEEAAPASLPPRRDDAAAPPTAPPTAVLPAPVMDAERNAAEALLSGAEVREALDEAAVSAPETKNAPEPLLERGARLPSAEMQRLMSSAGQSLRAVDVGIDRR